MKTLFFLVFVLSCTLVLAYPSAIAILEPVGSSTAYGDVIFNAINNKTVQVVVNLFDVPDGNHGLHIHSYGDITDKEAANAAGGHYAGQGSESHACPTTPNRHEGDMGNWTSINGRIYGTKEFDLLTLTGFYSIVGRAVILHQLPDDCTGSSGNAGARIAQAVVGIKASDDTTSSSGFNTVTNAVVSLSPTTYCSQCSGTVWFKKVDDQTIQVTARVEGLKYGTVHGFHIHELGDLTDPTGLSVSGHYNPTGANHGLPPNEPRHVGDLGNLQNYDSQSIGWYQLKTTSLMPFERILGRSIVIHELEDHGAGAGCSSSGNAGNRFMFGVIGVASDDQTPYVPIPIDNTWHDIDCNGNEPHPIFIEN